MSTRTACILGLVVVVAAGDGLARPTTAVLQVGPTRSLKTPSQAAAIARDWDVVEIDAGIYYGDVATWRAHNLTLRGVGGRPRLEANGNSAGGKAIWVLAGSNTTVENIEFSGCRVPDRNGAGIRQEGPGLTVRGCYFHHNEMGILAGSHSTSDLLIERSEFGYNGYGDGYSHNVYINGVRSLTFRFNYSHHANNGHLLKSRALTNHVLYNRFTDEGTGNSIYNIDLPNGGTAYVVGNLMHQSVYGGNRGMLSFAAEGATNPSQQAYIVNNTFVNDHSSGTFIALYGSPSARVLNNLFVGYGTPVSGSAYQAGNVSTHTPNFVSRSTYDYRPTASTPGINGGVDPGVDLRPVSHYVHPASATARPVVGAYDVGAYEYGTSTTTTPSGTGLTGAYYDNRDFTAWKLTRTDEGVVFDWGRGSPHASIGADHFSVRWTGLVEPQHSETYTFHVRSDDGARLWIDGRLIIDRWVAQSATEWSGSIALVGGRRYALKLEYFEAGGDAVAQLRWSSPSTPKALIPTSRLYAQ
ncbi:MAG TPA: PA14 domain-containing protein [Planctomycetota bacterium]|nr:PA14 domain-containing protein [Planctomycetota bacterium]